MSKPFSIRLTLQSTNPGGDYSEKIINTNVSWETFEIIVNFMNKLKTLL